MLAMPTAQATGWPGRCSRAQLAALLDQHAPAAHHRHRHVAAGRILAKVIRSGWKTQRLANQTMPGAVKPQMTSSLTSGMPA